MHPVCQYRLNHSRACFFGTCYARGSTVERTCEGFARKMHFLRMSGPDDCPDDCPWTSGQRTLSARPYTHEKHGLTECLIF